MQNDSFKGFIAHPKIQELFKDPEFKEAAKTKDFSKILAHPKLSRLMRDPEIAPMIAQLDLKNILGGFR